METGEEYFTKRYEREQLGDSFNRPNIIINLSNRHRKDHYHVIHPYTKSKPYDEPIDLTQGSHRSFKEEPGISRVFIKSKERRPKVCYQNTVVNSNRSFNSSSKATFQTYKPSHAYGLFRDVLDLHATESKQAEILKAAKSLFSKRTRTLYHWMYPNTPKQQIKIAVANSWDNLGTQEKQFYISQVLVKFGFPQCSLMVNPQLGGIQHLPPLANGSARELQTAISSITLKNNSTMSGGKRRQGRPPGSKNKKPKNEFVYKINKDFQDDPELSKELEKFAITFDCFK